MEKFMYLPPSLQIVLFKNGDLIRTSGEQEEVLKSGDDNLFSFSDFTGGAQ